MRTLHVNLIGRFGNQMFQYAYARALCENEGWSLITGPWIGHEIFDLPTNEATRLNQQQIEACDYFLEASYHQDQSSLIYTRKQVKEWFRLRPEVEDKLLGKTWYAGVVAHRRVGDYAKLGYVVVSMKSYEDAAMEFCGVRLSGLVTEEEPFLLEDFTGDLSFVPDFYRLMKAPVLFRANSTFSWWAATLGNGKVYSPVIEGLEGGKEQDCKFVEGNWPRFANLPFVTDLHLKP